MELHKSNLPVETHGAAGSQGAFSIAMNAKAFRVLSDGLYKDKIGSIVREISCNAFDSHIAVGTPDRQFEIHLPDKMEPWFYVRDFGTGLSPDAITTVFTSYFTSTKDQSNTAVGAFGLGAKTPFAYGDQFTVTSYIDGMMYAYSAFIAENGMPSIILMAETPTTEDNGVEIRLAVKDGDYKAFADAVRTQLNFFPVKPVVVNYSDNYGRVFEFNKTPEYLYVSDKVRIYRAGSSSYSAKINIVQGPVGYPIDFNLINRELDTENSDFLRMLNGIGADLLFDIGQISVIASREAAEYNEHTITNLKAAINAVRLELTKWISDKVENLPTVYEKAAWVNDNTDFRSIINGITLDLSPAKRDSQGRYYFVLSDIPAFTKTIKVQNQLTGKSEDQDINLFNISTYSAVNLSGFSTSRNASRDAQLFPSNNTDVVIALRDISNKPIVRMQHYFRENEVDTMYGLTYTQDDGTNPFTPKFIKEVKKALGGFENVLLVSEMDAPEKQSTAKVRATYAKPKCYIARMNGHDDLTSVSSWERGFTPLNELTDGGMYVVVDRQRIVTSIPYNVLNAFQILAKQDKFEKQLYAVREVDVQKLKDSGNDWVEFVPHVEAVRDRETSNPNIRRVVLARTISKSVQNEVGHRFLGLEGMKERNPIVRLARIQKRADAFTSKHKIPQDIINLADTKAETKAVEVISYTVNEFFKKLPLINNTRHGYGRYDAEEKAHIVEYINHFAG